MIESRVWSSLPDIFATSFVDIGRGLLVCNERVKDTLRAEEIARGRLKGRSRKTIGRKFHGEVKKQSDVTSCD